MFVYLLLSLFGLVNHWFFFVPLFLYIYLFIKKSPILPWLIFGLGLLGDLFWVFPLGYSSTLFSLFLLITALYSQKYNLHNQLLLFIWLSVISLVMLKLAGLPFSVNHVLVFLSLFTILSIQTREWSKNSLKSLA